MISFSSLATAGGVTNIVASTTACGVIRVEGWFYGAADKYLLFFDSPTLPGNGAVPYKSYALPNTAYFIHSFTPQELETNTGFTVAISDTQDTLTISASKADFEGEVEPRSYIPQNYSVAGDTLTGRDFLQVWADATGPKAVYQVDYTNNDGATRYLMLFATDNGATANGASPLEVWKVLNGATLTLKFGAGGKSPMSQDTNFVNHVGCTLQQSSSVGVGNVPTLTKTVSAVSYFRAYYQ